jgi:hypothetical protein
MVDISRPDPYVITANGNGNVMGHVLYLMKFR